MRYQLIEEFQAAFDLDVLDDDAGVDEIKLPRHGRQRVVRQRQHDIVQTVQFAVALRFGQHGRCNVNAHHLGCLRRKGQHEPAHAAAKVQHPLRRKGGIDVRPAHAKNMVNVMPAVRKELFTRRLVECTGAEFRVGQVTEPGVP